MYFKIYIRIYISNFYIYILNDLKKYKLYLRKYLIISLNNYLYDIFAY